MDADPISIIFQGRKIINTYLVCRCLTSRTGGGGGRRSKKGDEEHAQRAGGADKEWKEGETGYQQGS
jgi:hypothetical protein